MASIYSGTNPTAFIYISTALFCFTFGDIIEGWTIFKQLPVYTISRTAHLWQQKYQIFVLADSWIFTSQIPITEWSFPFLLLFKFLYIILQLNFISIYFILKQQPWTNVTCIFGFYILVEHILGISVSYLLSWM